MITSKRVCIIIPESPFLGDEMIVFPLGPAYIKRYVQENSPHIVDILNGKNLSKKDLMKYSVIGFSTVTANILNIEKFLPINRTTVIGGPHITHYKDDLSKKIKENIDFIVPGDGCEPFLSILNNEKIKFKPDDRNQLPCRDNKSQEKYKYKMYGLKATNMITSRGCPYNCYFCEEATKPVRFKDLKYIEKEVRECKKLGYEFISFSDDLFCISLKRIKKISELMQKYNMKFRCLCRANTFTDEMSRVLSKSGCLEVGFGIETLSQKILDIINKKTTVEQIKNTINLIKKYGMKVRASFMIGLPGETLETMQKIHDFIQKSFVNYIVVFIYHPYRGTYIYDNIEQFDIQLPKNYNDNMHLLGKNGSVESCGVSTSSLSSEEIFEFHKKLLRLKKEMNM